MVRRASNCPVCGREMGAGAQFCNYCGHKLGEPLPQRAYAYAPPPGPQGSVAGVRRSNTAMIGCIVAAAVFVFLLPIVGIIVAVAVPNFIKVKEKAKEAEVKQNLHAIQLALERYATDHGAYPRHLYGGDALGNIGTVNYYSPAPRTGAAYWERPIHLPYDMFHLVEADGWDYADAAWNALVDPADGASRAFGDVLQYEGYMPTFPSNPFQAGSEAAKFGTAGIDHITSPLGIGEWACYGGRDGHKMWNLGCFGELPQLKMYADGSQDLRLDFPGCFYYHPRFDDGATNYGHNRIQQPLNPGSWLPWDADPGLPTLLDDSSRVNTHDVAGYDLVACGSPRTKGLDLDSSVAGKGTANMFRTGYLALAQEQNPYVGPRGPEGDYGGSVGAFDERPYSDSVPDFYIIHLGSGLDRQLSQPQVPY